MKFLLFGADGQVGFELHRTLHTQGEVIPCTRSGLLPSGLPCLSLNLENQTAIKQLIETQKPDYLINAAAYTAVDRAEQEPDLAHQINATAVQTIADSAQSTNTHVIHFSTDYVFSGDTQKPYCESDITAPKSVYGQSKCAGELALTQSDVSSLIFRTSWVYATRGKNFLRTMLRLAHERDSISVVNDQHGTPNSARMIAQVVANIVDVHKRLGRNEQKQTQGIYHLTAHGETTWFGFAQAIFELAVRARLINKMPKLTPISSDAFASQVQRPKYSLLNNQKIERVFGLKLPHWNQSLDLIFGNHVASDEKKT